MKTEEHSLGVEANNQKDKRNLSLLILRSDSFLKMIQALTNSFGTSGSAMIFNMGLGCGYSEGMQVREDSGGFKSNDKRDLIQKAFLRSSKMGWGIISLSYFDPVTGVLGISLAHNPFMDNCGSERQEGCHFLKGYVAGIVSELMETDMVFQADSCKGIQNGSCILQMERASDRSARKIKELFESVSEKIPDNR